MNPKIDLDKINIALFCAKWDIAEFSFFGSVLRDDFNDASDIDVLVRFAPSAHWSLFDFMEMREELHDKFGREVDLIEKDGIRNPYRRHEILTTRRIVYAHG